MSSVSDVRWGLRNVCCLLVMPIALGQTSLRGLRGFTQRGAGASLRAGLGRRLDVRFGQLGRG